MDLVTVARFQEPYAAHLARAALEDAGIRAFVSDDHTVGIIWVYSNALGGVRVQVGGSDLEAARRLLGDLEQGEAGSEEACAACGGTSLRRSTLRRRTKALSLLIGWILVAIPFVAGAKHVRCEDCGKRWTPVAEPASPLTSAAEQAVRHLDRVPGKSEVLRGFLLVIAALVVLFGVRWVLQWIESP